MAGTSPSPTRPAPRSAWPPFRWARQSRWMWWWAEVSAGGTRSSGTVIFAIRARHSARRPHRTGASACRTRAVTLLRQPDIVGRELKDIRDGGAALTLRDVTDGRYSRLRSCGTRSNGHDSTALFL